MAVPNHTPRWLALDGAANARAVVPGVLLRADNLQSLSPRDVRLLVEEEALEVVVDLRTDIEVLWEGPGPLTAEAAVRIEHRSLYPDAADERELVEAINPWGNARPADDFPGESPVVRAYLSYLRQRPDSIVGSLRTIARADGAVLVHCAAGKDRTGVVVALALDAAAFDRELIVSDYGASTERIDQIVARLMRSETYRSSLSPDPQAHAVAPATMERFLGAVDTHLGGTVGWLAANGFDESDLRLLQERLTAARADERAA